MPTTPTAPATAKWSSQFAFLMAAIGAAVGLGNLWRFPFQTGQNGGSAFVIIYLICVVFIAAPILMAEFAIGRRKGLSAVGSPAALAKEVGSTPLWGVIGLVGIFASFLVLTTYSVIAGQILSFSLMSFMGVFEGDAAGATLPLFDGPGWTIFWFSLFLLMNVVAVAGGLRSGVERLVTVLMPIFFFLLAGLAIYALSTGAAGRTMDYLFAPRFDEVTPDIILAAMGQAFYSIAVGTAAMLTYGAFLDRQENIAANAGLIAGADTVVALVAGLMIFPIVFAFSLDPAAGMGLIFDALPNVFAGMPGGSAIGGLFFFLAFIAALTSSISMLLVTVALFEEWLGWSKPLGSVLIGGAAWVIGVAGVFTHGMAETVDFLAGSVLLPVSALLGAVFAGWVVPRKIMRDEFHNASERTFGLWRALIRWVCPAAVGTILVFGLLAKFGG